jgi:hypothetical protein
MEEANAEFFFGILFILGGAYSVISKRVTMSPGEGGGTPVKEFRGATAIILGLIYIYIGFVLVYDS